LFVKNTNRIINIIDKNIIYNNNNLNNNNLNNNNLNNNNLNNNNLNNNNLNNNNLNNNNLNNNNLNIFYEKRIKSKERAILKIQKLKIPYDIFGLRIIYNDSADYHNTKFAYIIKNIIYENFNTLDYIYDDYIEKPKENNYQSLHIYIVTNLLIEIQIRNSNMHNISINGSASQYY
jgi:(p)ppGpp synthase/HD superfamily hydrolase